MSNILSNKNCLLSLFISFGFLTACSQSPENTTTAQSSSASVDDNRYKVVTEANNIPFVYLDEKGKPMGFDIDIMQAIADDQQFQVDYEVTVWSALMNDMASNKADLGLASISITDERKQTYQFSEPYFQSQLAVLTNPMQKTDKALDFSIFQGKTIGVKEHTIADTTAKTLKLTTKPRAENFLAVTDFLTGKTQGVIGDIGVLQYYQKQYADKNLAVVTESDVKIDNYGIIVNKNKPNLLIKINNGLKNIKTNGKYQQIEQKWFGNS